MAQLYTKVKLYLEANGKTENEIGPSETYSSVFLRNEGTLPSEAYIYKWDVSGVNKPTDSQINSYETAANTLESNNNVRNTRKKAYGDIGEQLDEIYKDIDAWKARIKKIKDDNPKS